MGRVHALGWGWGFSPAPAAPSTRCALVTFCPALAVPTGADHFPPALSFPFSHVGKVPCPGQGGPSPGRQQELPGPSVLPQDKSGEAPPAPRGDGTQGQGTAVLWATGHHTPEQGWGDSGVQSPPIRPAQALRSHRGPLCPSRPGQAPLSSLDPSHWEAVRTCGQREPLAQPHTQPCCSPGLGPALRHGHSLGHL